MLHNKKNTILLYGDIDEKMLKMFTMSMMDMAHCNNVLIRINSYGGDLLCGIGIINIMRQYRGNAITLVDGFAASTASLIAASGNARFMFKTSFHLAHKEQNDCPKNSPMFNNIINSIYKGVNLPQDIWLTARESFEYGICDKLI